ncbi:hypothetical protein MCOR07_000573 [Pyricularia oryzae]|nr:hypothetical protein MCOR01_011580 [Pyricularia oryzae]KAI6314203.1 hypothetical protein MCOR29_007422 [Pyricularia oryzae]KAI6356591.1 hypothetical protein MCOR31_010668 [Pyricularia oryzae]KAI6396560.1 hypothetical protein MCOR23_006583 [Pyricularia oryzae]KAI6419305.1 hypothetical protein MCOR24_005091 [Pyricularia oryzae]
MDDSYGFMLDPSWHANTCLDSNFLDNVEGIQDSRSHSGALPGSNVDFNYGTFITELNNCEKEDLRRFLLCLKNWKSNLGRALMF